ncbi:MAG: acrylyl-CoA reductase [Acidobacteriota bacterium]|jgi:putative YhdH/YhfP family quinone oxidoreductase|nr:acrylyl-CoA reductase [Acidobacteriota bacterium]
MSKALLATNTDGYRVALTEIPDSEMKGDVLVDVAYSSLNYKDALAVTGRGKIVRRFPMVLGIDLAGTVVESSSSDYKPGARVLAVGQGLGESEWGGYAERQRVRADALVPLPDGISLEQSMQIGTAGFTAMLCVLALARNNVVPSERELLVTGAAGGVGSVAVMLLAGRGYRVAVSTGRPELEPYFRELGATTIVPRSELATAGAPMQSERWGGAVDTVGGVTLANVFAQTAYGGAIACCGMAGGHELPTTVWPLILRNVSLLGISSIRTPKRERVEAWTALARELDERKLATIARTEPLSRIQELAEEILGGGVRGRVVVDVNG